jgi:hypothetical protein
MAQDLKTLPPEVLARFEQFMADLRSHKRACPLGQGNVIEVQACFGCRYGHMAGCHYPHQHSLAQCGHAGPGDHQGGL